MLNPNIILQGRGVEINNPMDVAVKGMQLKQLSQQSQLADRALQDDQAMRDAYRKNITKGADGKMSLNRQGMMTSLGPKQALDFQKLLQGQDLEKMAADVKISGQLAFSVQDEATYLQARAKAIEMGIPNADKLPEQYSPMTVQRWQMASMSGTEQTAKAMADQKLNYQKEQDVLGQKNKDRDYGMAAQKLQMERVKDGAYAGQSDGIKALDKDFAKDHNEWTSGGKDRARTEIAKLRDVSMRLTDNTGGTGGLTGVMPDRFTSPDVLKNRADVQQSAMTLIKQLLSGATSDKDREAIVNTLWNESDTTENNIARVDRFALDMESRANNMDRKSKAFEQSGTLRGFDSYSQQPSMSQGKPLRTDSQQPSMSQGKPLRTNQIEWAD